MDVSIVVTVPQDMGERELRGLETLAGRLRALVAGQEREAKAGELGALGFATSRISLYRATVRFQRDGADAEIRMLKHVNERQDERIDELRFALADRLAQGE